MPKVQTFKAPWTAQWGATTPPILYSGENLTSEDRLITSVGTNPGGENPFQSEHRTLLGSIGQALSQPPSGKFFTEPWGPSTFGSGTYSQAPNVSWNAANLWARTNPTRPVILLPVFWAEIRDVPRLIRDAGRAIRRKSDLNEDNLAVQFGAAPLVRDLWTLYKFQASVAKRKKEFEKNSSKKGYKHRIGLGTTSYLGSKNGFANFGSYRNFSINFTEQATKRSWAVMHWRPTSPNTGLPSNDDDLSRYLKGYHPSQILINLWEGLPWTWLIDYFTNIGDVLAAGNHYALTPNGGSVMTMNTTIGQHKLYSSGNDILTAGVVRVTSRGRAPASNASVTAFLPSLTAGQLSILGSLSVLRRR